MAPPSKHPPQWNSQGRPRPPRGGFPPTTRRAILERDPQCRIAGPGCEGPSAEADHIINYPTAMGMGYTLEQYNAPENGQGACRRCHRTKTQTEAAAGRARAKAQRQRRRGRNDRHPGLTD